MQPAFFIQRTTTDHPSFQQLITLLDSELFNELKEDQATYDPLNKVSHLNTAILVFVNDEAVACGCFKEWDSQTVEIKRMFVRKGYRGKGYAKEVLHQLERWAQSVGYRYAVLETSIHFLVAKTLYKQAGYHTIPNYPPYEELPESVCMKKTLL